MTYFFFLLFYSKFYTKDSILKNDEQMAVRSAVAVYHTTHINVSVIYWSLFFKQILVDLLESVGGLRFCLKVEDNFSGALGPLTPLRSPSKTSHSADALAVGKVCLK